MDCRKKGTITIFGLAAALLAARLQYQAARLFICRIPRRTTNRIQIGTGGED
jgi:hypothetical protein